MTLESFKLKIKNRNEKKLYFKILLTKTTLSKHNLLNFIQECIGSLLLLLLLKFDYTIKL